MLNVGALEEGFVLDHIKAGKAMTIYHDLKLDKLDCCVAIIKNARSNKMGRKDIIKIECPLEMIDLDILGFIDHNITVNIIENEKIVDKTSLKLPKKITNVIRCKNPRCITSIEQGLDHVFVPVSYTHFSAFQALGKTPVPIPFRRCAVSFGIGTDGYGFRKAAAP